MLKKNFKFLALVLVFLSTSLLNAAESQTLLSGSIYQKSAQDSSYVVMQNMDLSFFLQGELVTSVTTDESGAFAVENLKEGTYLLVAESVDGESFGATSLPVQYDENGNLVANFKMTNVGIQRLPEGFDPMGKNAVRGQEAEAEADANADEEGDDDKGAVLLDAPAPDGVAVQRPGIVPVPAAAPAVLPAGAFSPAGSGIGGGGFLPIALGAAGVILGAIALADEDDDHHRHPRPVSPER